MEGYIKISDFMDYLDKHDKVITDRRLVDERARKEGLQKALLRRKMLTFREIADADLWGDNLSAAAVRAYANKHVKPKEMIEVSHGKRKEYKITIGAVERIAIKKGTWHSLAK